ncbi:hypothetical protein [Aureispira sp. CCB-E]|uniref:hypothetical protein n=1 Tax=Aureispira sp. CCB-E TaxID=3051121 RepID=UPI002868CCCA|nr:hypothetical protein [Aureispira sp. CCB-E]WMX16200.1 hypothetical protein QP953_07465 [Aureispira sp. CCB-E]
MMEENLETQMAAVQQALQIAMEYQLEVEVVTWALKAMQENNTITITEALAIGVNEWVK